MYLCVAMLAIICLVADDPHTPSFDPLQETYHLGDSVECMSNANPAPHYMWESQVSPAGSGIKIPGSLLFITETMISEDPEDLESTNM